MTLHRPSPDRRPRRFPHPPRWSPLFPPAVPLLCLSTWAALTPWTAPSLAQTIVADTTLQQPTIVQQSGSPRLWTITGGTPNQAGNLLFHSFLFFTLGSGETVLFNNSPQVNNIFARVTGTVASSLPGTLRTSNPANLFLLNPNGVRMNGQTRLDIGGSFFASTGDRLIFADGSYFSARSPNPAPLLVVNPPTALWMGNNPGDIIIGGGTHGLRFNSDFSINRQFQATGTAVSPGQFMGLIGNSVTFNGSYLRATQGTIEVASLASGTVQLKTPTTDSPWHFSYDEASSRFSPITLNSRTALDVSGPGGGNLSLQGSQIAVNAGSTLIADTLGSQVGGLLRVRGTESVTVAGVGGTSPNVFASSLFAAVNPGASGQGGTLEVITPFFRTANGAIIGVDTFGSGNAGTLRVQGGVVEVDRADWSVQSSSAASGRGGEIDLNIDTLRVLNGGQILAQSLGQGSAGRVFIEAKDSVLIQGERLTTRGNVLNSVITAFQGERSRGSGQVEITAGSLRLQDGGRISMTSRSTDASLGQGSLVITARDFVEVTGTSSNGAPSLITTTAEGGIKGDRITITTPYLTARQGGQISSGTFGQGAGGDLQLTVAETLTLEGRSAVIPGNNLGNLPVFKDITGAWFPSGLLAGSTGIGSAGTLAVQAKAIILRDHAEMTVSGESSGNAGNLVIQDSDLIQLQGESKIRGDTRSGAGNIQINGDRLELTENSSITTNALGQTLESGNITVEVGSLSLDRSLIASDTVGGRAGDVSITATQLPGLLLNQGRISANGGLGDLSLKAPLIVLQNQSLVSTNGQGIPSAIAGTSTTSDGGNITVASIEPSQGTLRLSDSKITANAQNSNGGSIRLEIPEIYLDQASAITT
ncbi:MAG: filamentous hemagglutinin N-terminal domain-containing protein, partial [Prochlorothrix sp.]|nr:filamentous hemagglutinin N-terminal domain-containing protein [Prochlorothrix sp.]